MNGKGEWIGEEAERKSHMLLARSSYESVSVRLNYMSKSLVPRASIVLRTIDHMEQ